MTERWSRSRTSRTLVAPHVVAWREAIRDCLDGITVTVTRDAAETARADDAPTVLPTHHGFAGAASAAKGGRAKAFAPEGAPAAAHCGVRA
ncbi:MAG: hypothetical protein IPF60_10835 [Betaproteobacteria bacterium]|nr:hypothetical protein [Betaproteobacteria bacterium]